MSNETKKMPFIGHIGELRKRIIWCLVFFACGLIAGLAAAVPAIDYLLSVEPFNGFDLRAFSPWDGIRIYMQVAVLIGLILSLPLIFHQIWLFVRPGLRPHEQRAALMYVPGAAVLLIAGLAFGYFVVFPLAVYFTGLMIGRLNLTETYGVVQYFSFMFNILLPVSLMFEMPVIVLFLTKLRILNPKRLHRLRRYAYLALLIISALITPPDLLSALVVAVPMVLLYELGIVLSRIVYRKQLAADAAWEAEYGPK